MYSSLQPKITNFLRLVRKLRLQETENPFCGAWLECRMFQPKGSWGLTLLFFSIFAFSLAVSFVATRQVRDVATRRGWVSLPRDGRHVHESPLPRLGGVAIFPGFLGQLGRVSRALPHISPSGRWTRFRHASPYLCSSVPDFCLGIYDDLHGAGPYLKFAVQAIAAAMLFAGGMRVFYLPVLFGQYTLPWFISLPLTVLWVVAITNAFNLIDGLDGLAAGSALFSTMVFFVVRWSIIPGWAP